MATASGAQTAAAPGMAKQAVAQKPVFAAAGVQGTTAPSGYAAGVSEEDTDQARDAVAGADAQPEDCGKLRTLEQAHALDPGDVAGTLQLARAYVAAGEPARAMPLLEPVTRGVEGNARAWLVQGDAQAAMGHAVEAMASYRHSAQLDGGESNGVACGEGILALSPADALPFLADQVRAHTTSARLWADLGASQITMGQQEAAAGSLLHASELDPDAVLPITLMAQLHGLPVLVTDRVSERIRTYVAAHPENARARWSYAQELWRQESEAPNAAERQVLVTELRRSLALDPGLVDSERLLGLVEQQAGDHAEAARTLQAVLRQQPEDAAATYQLALAYRDMGQRSQAEAAMQQFRALQQKSAPRPAARHAACAG